MGRATFITLGSPAGSGFVAMASAGHRSTAVNICDIQQFIQIGITMNFNLSFLENNVSINEDTWKALVTTGSDVSLANVRTAIMGVLEHDGAFTVEDLNDQVVRRIETSSEFEGFMQEVDMQRTQFQQDQAQ
jgi:hypothetical protein